MKPLVARHPPRTMLNDRSSLLSMLETRRSEKPRNLVAPGPTAAELKRILTIAARTPDHGTLTPWRFIEVADDQRDALADLLLAALDEKNPAATAAHREKEVGFAHYAGQLIVLVSAPVQNHKIPVWEQELSCGAAGMNLLLAAQALGFAAGWVTGWRAYSKPVLDAFCEPGERIAGFIFIGTSTGELVDRVRPDLDCVVSRWTAPTH